MTVTGDMRRKRALDEAHIEYFRSGVALNKAKLELAEQVSDVLFGRKTILIKLI